MSQERWLLTYADMITLLLVLFIVLFALSKINQAKYRQFQQSVSHIKLVGDVGGARVDVRSQPRTGSFVARPRTISVRSNRSCPMRWR